MNTRTANKIIAEFMGWVKRKDGYGWDLDNSHGPVTEHIVASNPYHYTNDLNSLVPVWEKLNNSGLDVRCISLNFAENVAQLVEAYAMTGKTIQEAAAIATAKTILELKK